MNYVLCFLLILSVFSILLFPQNCTSNAYIAQYKAFDTLCNTKNALLSEDKAISFLRVKASSSIKRSLFGSSFRIITSNENSLNKRDISLRFMLSSEPLVEEHSNNIDRADFQVQVYSVEETKSHYRQGKELPCKGVNLYENSQDLKAENFYGLLMSFDYLDYKANNLASYVDVTPYSSSNSLIDLEKSPVLLEIKGSHNDNDQTIIDEFHSPETLSSISIELNPLSSPAQEDSFPTSMLSSAKETTTITSPTQEIFLKAGKRALGGGLSGALASFLQVTTLMWLRTAMNYQYRNGGSLQDVLKKLYNEGGIARLYKGLQWAIIQVPLARFGDTAANAFVLVLLDSFPVTALLGLPVWSKTILGSIAAGLWRIVIMPIDTIKTTLQVGGKNAYKNLRKEVLKEGKVSYLYGGSIAMIFATIIGHYPWFLTYNTLSSWIPASPESIDFPSNPFYSLDPGVYTVLRNAFLGLCAACTSDICSNSVRVIKTAKQTSIMTDEEVDDDKNKEAISRKADTSAESLSKGMETSPSYIMVIKKVISDEGIEGLFGRGLKTRLITNGLQGMMFSVAWKYMESILSNS